MLYLPRPCLQVCVSDDEQFERRQRQLSGIHTSSAAMAMHLCKRQLCTHSSTNLPVEQCVGFVADGACVRRTISLQG